MFSRLHKHFGTAGLVVAIVALIAALGGGAYAASGGSEGGKATASAKGKPGPKGPKGAKGAKGDPGPAGPTGPTGPAGAKGDKGDAGAKGDNGSNGSPGASVSSEEFGVAGKDGKCVGVGGTKFTGTSGSTYACNGKNGTNGLTGFTETLPAGKTETGTWAFGPSAAGISRVPLSFAIPLAAGLSETKVHYLNAANEEVPSSGPPVPSTACHGTAASPSADAGNLCVYTGSSFEAKSSNGFISDAVENPGAGKSGAIVIFENLENGAFGLGTWAVTAEE